MDSLNCERLSPDAWTTPIAETKSHLKFRDILKQNCLKIQQEKQREMAKL